MELVVVQEFYKEIISPAQRGARRRWTNFWFFSYLISVMFVIQDLSFPGLQNLNLSWEQCPEEPYVCLWAFRSISAAEKWLKKEELFHLSSVGQKIERIAFGMISDLIIHWNLTQTWKSHFIQIQTSLNWFCLSTCLRLWTSLWTIKINIAVKIRTRELKIGNLIFELLNLSDAYLFLFPKWRSRVESRQGAKKPTGAGPVRHHCVISCVQRRFAVPSSLILQEGLMPFSCINFTDEVNCALRW